MRLRRLSLWAAGGGGAMALVAIVLRGSPAAPPASDPAPMSHETRPLANSSLAGTTPDGAAVATAGDVLVLNPGLIHLFDYYLTTVGERPIAAIQAQVNHDLDGRLRPHAARQAKNLFDRYVQFKTALKAQRPAQASGRSVDTLREGLRRMLALRAAYFDTAESQALFAPQDAEADLALERMDIEQDPALTDAQRRDRLAALDARLPANVREDREAPLAVVHLEQAAQQIRAQGGSEDDVYRMRAAATSPEAANRLAEVDRDEVAWKARIAAYQSQRAAVLSSPGDDTDRAASISDLRNRLFTPQEQRRLAAYEG